ncbi:Hpt domain-containing protein [Dechloromonas sp. XY25]|uniref:Hpt domain-containing protein n=1 Tax=Dechloromonas hankyongensis TaxID=2908002 RepID=A0ABS9K4Y3_9RHOO|nr:Hpt domain-containing protein [Dechloromonas hankyongensis]MCG2578200.1 Hpt domain-containing protein [Dechloromonas hankyongensis]
MLDRAAILQRLGGDEEIYTMMVAMFLDDVDNNCAALSAAFAAGDLKSVQREAHTIKGLLATFSDDEGAGDAMTIESTAKSGTLAGLAGAIGNIQLRLKEVAAALGKR